MANNVRSCDKAADHSPGDRHACHHYLGRESRGCRKTSNTDAQQYHDCGQCTRTANGDLQTADPLKPTLDHCPTLRLPSQLAHPGHPKPSRFMVHGCRPPGLPVWPGPVPGRAGCGRCRVAMSATVGCGCCRCARCRDLQAAHVTRFLDSRTPLDNKTYRRLGACWFCSASRTGQEMLKGARCWLRSSWDGDDHLRSSVPSARRGASQRAMRSLWSLRSLGQWRTVTDIQKDRHLNNMKAATGVLCSPFIHNASGDAQVRLSRAFSLVSIP